MNDTATPTPPEVTPPEVTPPEATAPEATVPEEAVVVTMDAQEIEKGKTLAILGYIIPILCIVPLIQKDNDFSLYHAKQVLLLFIAAIALSFLNVIPCLGQIVWSVGTLALLVFGIMGLINAIKGEAKPIPLIGKFAEEWFKGIQKKS